MSAVGGGAGAGAGGEAEHDNVVAALVQEALDEVTTSSSSSSSSDSDNDATTVATAASDPLAALAGLMGGHEEEDGVADLVVEAAADADLDTPTARAFTKRRLQGHDATTSGGESDGDSGSDSTLSGAAPTSDEDRVLQRMIRRASVEHRHSGSRGSSRRRRRRGSRRSAGSLSSRTSSAASVGSNPRAAGRTSNSSRSHHSATASRGANPGDPVGSVAGSERSSSSRRLPERAIGSGQHEVDEEDDGLSADSEEEGIVNTIPRPLQRMLTPVMLASTARKETEGDVGSDTSTPSGDDEEAGAGMGVAATPRGSYRSVTRGDSNSGSARVLESLRSPGGSRPDSSGRFRDPPSAHSLGQRLKVQCGRLRRRCVAARARAVLAHERCAMTACGIQPKARIRTWQYAYAGLAAAELLGVALSM